MSLMNNNIILLTKNINNQSIDCRFNDHSYLVNVVFAELTDFSNEDFVNKYILDTTPKIVLISSIYSIFLDEISSITRKLLPDSIIIQCGTYLKGWILRTNVQIVSRSFDYIFDMSKDHWANDVISFLGRIMITKSNTLKIIKMPNSIEIIPELKYLPTTIDESISQLTDLKLINESIKNNYYQNRFLVIAGLPKSGSTMFGDIISILTRMPRGYGKYMLPNSDSDLRLEMMLNFKNGGIMKFHPAPSGKNILVLNRLGSKYFIYVRHPIDQLVAIYCHHSIDNHPNEIIFDHIYPFHRKIYKLDLNDALSYFIKDGYLLNVLKWITDWLVFRNPNQSLLVKYEDLLNDFEKQIDKISMFLNGNNCSKATLDQCIHRIKSTKIPNNIKKYPKGWTGNIGIWKKYFSEKNYSEYKSVIESFFKYYPNANLLLDVYGNLLNP